MSTHASLYSLSTVQQEVWLKQMLYPDAPLGNIGGYLCIDGVLDTALFVQAVNHAVAEDDGLNTVFYAGTDARPQQSFARDSASPMDIRDFSTEPDPVAAAQAWMDAEFLNPFDLYGKHLYRFTLCKISDNRYYWLQQYHEIIADPYVLADVTRRAGEVYRQLHAGENVEAQPRPAFSAFLEAEQVYRDGGEFAQDLSYWREQYREFPEPWNPPRALRKPQSSLLRSARASLLFNVEEDAALRAFAEEAGVSPFSVVLAGFYTYLTRTSAREDFTWGLAVPAWRQHGFEHAPGFFMNLLPMWLKLGTALSFTDLARAIDTQSQQARACGRCPIGDINRELALAGEGREQLFNFEIVYLDLDFRFGDYPAEYFPLTNGYEQYALTVYVQKFRADRPLRIDMDYNEGFYSAAEMNLLAARLRHVLNVCLAAPEQAVNDMSLLPQAEHDAILHTFNAAADYPTPTQTVTQLFEAQAAKAPEAVAARFGDTQISYAELNRRANRLAHYLRGKGLQSGALVGLCVERSIAMLVGMVGILKAGGAYLPLDPSFPHERLALMLEDSQAVILLGSAELDLHFDGVHTVYLDADWDTIASHPDTNADVVDGPDSLAYVIYTSGSTGKPKGVMVPHRAIIRLVLETNYVQLTPADCIAQASNNSFDAATFEIWGALLNGAHLEGIRKEELLSSQTFYDLLREREINVLFLTTALFNQFVSEYNDIFAPLKYLLFGGEAVDPARVRQVLEQGKPEHFLHVYGPTENTTFSSWYDIREVPDNAVTVPIGGPLAGTSFYVLDASNRPVPVGVPGELYLGGMGLAQGYWQRPKLSTEKFVLNPFGAGRLYRTGDLVRWRPEGVIEFIGRADHQIKLRGFRIELGEIEAVLEQHPAVEKAVVLMQQDHEGDNRLVGFLQPASSAESEESAGDAEEYIHLWHELYEQTYSDQADNEETLNSVGWISSYTGQAIPAQEMREWADQAVNRILALKPRKVLELGCGTGMLLGKVAPHCDEYVGTDFSAKALDYVRDMQHKLGGLGNVQLFERWADDFSDLPEKHFDLIVLNSVTQHFPNMDYMVKVLRGMLGALTPGGKIYFGDISNFSSLETFHTSIQSYRADASTTAARLREIIRQAVADERDLLVAPAFFNAVRNEFPAITHVQVEPKHGQYHNQLTRFRFEALLYTDPALQVRRDLEWEEWRDGTTLDDLRARLRDTQPALLALRNIPNARMHAEMLALDWLQQAAPDTPLMELRTRIGGDPHIGLEPDAVWGLGEELSYQVEVSWLNTGTEGHFDAVFTHREQVWQAAEFQPLAAPQAWPAYANSRAQQTTVRLKQDVREHLQTLLPDYMVPAVFAVVERFPLNPNGKIDRKALARLEVDDTEQAASIQAMYMPPGDDLESLLADLWAETLDLPRVGIHDDFFKCGGNSLKGMELLNKLHKRLQHSFPITTLFEYTTVAAFADYLRKDFPALAELVKVSDTERESGEI